MADAVWGINSVQEIYQWNGTAWTQIPGDLVSIAVNGDQVWGINRSQQIYKWNGTGWTQVQGDLVSIAVGSDGQVWGLNSSQEIYQWNGSGWTQIPGDLMRIAVNGGQVWGINRSQEIYKRNGAAWTQIPGDLVSIAVGSDGQVWGINSSQEIYQWNGTGWRDIPGDLLAIAVDGVAALGVEYQAPPGQTGIKHIFVLMMENRSYDHFLGYSFITGTDTQTGQPTVAEGLVNADGSLKGDYYNDFTFPTWQAPTTPSPSVSATSDVVNRNPPPPPPPPPPYWMTSRFPVTNTAGDETFDHKDPQHQFSDVMMQLCGQEGGRIPI
jgi:hypothetical protein